MHFLVRVKYVCERPEISEFKSLFLSSWDSQGHLQISEEEASPKMFPRKKKNIQGTTLTYYNTNVIYYRAMQKNFKN